MLTVLVPATCALRPSAREADAPETAAEVAATVADFFKNSRRDEEFCLLFWSEDGRADKLDLQ